MIVGLVLRYFKTYQGFNYIPLTGGEKFCGFVGNNGIGKSSILESLDCFFNDKSWNYNIATKKSGVNTTSPSITPIFLIKKDTFKEENRAILEKLSNSIWSINNSDFATANRANTQKFIDHREILSQEYDSNDYYLFPLGIDYQNHTTLGIFKTNLIENSLKTSEDDTNFLENLNPIFEEIYNLYQYIYIPKDIDPSTFTKLETNEIQALMGESLFEIVEDRVKPAQIAEINSKLNEFLNTLADELEVYSFRTPTDRQKNVRKNEVYSLIIEAFFSIRNLHKKQGEHWLEINNLSSGEKQKAIIEITHNLIKHHRANNDNLIIAVDEPESSLHMSACFDHFLKMNDISNETHQFLFSTHWYGFLPIIEQGSVTAITKNDTESHRFDLISLSNYRELVKQQIRNSRGKLPYDIRLKSMNDFVQSIVSSILDDNPFNWIICEGSSEKIYFDYYFEDLRSELKLRIIPVGGVNEVKRIYEYVVVAIEEFKNEVNGKIAFILDTDSQFVDFETKSTDNIFIKRLININEEKETKLININSNPKSPATEIEDVLNGKAFNEVLKTYFEDYPDSLHFLDLKKEIEEIPAFYALDLRQSEREALSHFFDIDNNKFDFANKYIEELETSGNYQEMNWITEIRKFFENE